MKNKNQSGFTLIEAMISLGIIVVIVLALGMVLFYAVTLHEESQHRTIALQDAMRVTEEIRYIADSVGLTGTNSVTDPNRQWNALLSNLLPSQTVQVGWSGANPLQISVQVNWVERGRSLNVSLNTMVTRR